MALYNMDNACDRAPECGDRTGADSRCTRQSHTQSPHERTTESAKSVHQCAPAAPCGATGIWQQRQPSHGRLHTHASQTTPSHSIVVAVSPRHSMLPPPPSGDRLCQSPPVSLAVALIDALRHSRHLAHARGSPLSGLSPFPWVCWRAPPPQ